MLEKGSWPCGKIGLQMSLAWTGQAEIKILSEIFEYPSLSNMWGFLTVFQIIWDTGGIVRRGGREGGGGGIIFGLTSLLPMQGFQGSMLMLIPTHFYGMSPDSIPIFRLHNIWSRPISMTNFSLSQSSRLILICQFTWAFLVGQTALGQSSYWTILDWNRLWTKPKHVLENCSSSNFMRAAHCSSANPRAWWPLSGVKFPLATLPSRKNTKSLI